MDIFKRFFLMVKKNKKQIMRYSPLLLVLIVLVVTFVSCWQRVYPPEIETEPPVSEETPSEEPSPFPEPLPTPEPTDIEEIEPEPEPEPEDVYTGPVNPLTGLPVENDISNNRPLAIMINNHPAAMPQLGVSKADIIYEILAEGDITRMLALYQDITDADKIGSIRSARHYFVDVAQSYDAIYVFAGGSPQAYSAISARRITYLDGVLGVRADSFFRDPYRRDVLRMDSEHTLVTTSELLAKWLPTYNIRLEHEEGYERDLAFVEDGTPEDGLPATELTVDFFQKTTSFSYDDEDGLYYLSQFGRPYIDGNDDTQLSFTNILILKTDVSWIPGDTAGRRNVRTTGTGVGHFVCGGEYVDIEWSRDDNDSQFSYTLQDGTALALGCGKTYVCIIPAANVVDFG